MPVHPYSPNPRQPTRPARWSRCACLAALLALAGCGAENNTLSIDQLEQGFMNDRQVEADLGEFSIPIPVLQVAADGASHYENTVLLRFNLWALVAPKDEALTKRLIKRNRGKLCDRVITECRNAPLADVQDPNLTALRSRVLDRLQPLFEGDILQRVFVTNVLIDPF